MEKLEIPPFLPLLPGRVWRTYAGGRTLDLMQGKAAAEDSHFPEDWILSTTRAVNKGREEFTEEGLSCTVIGGQEYLLRDLFADYPQEMLGAKHESAIGKGAGFLLKYLDSSVRLHLQCHPTREFSRLHLNANAGKTEGYIILGTRPGVAPYIYMGFQRPPAPAALRAAVEAQDTDFILSCFDKIPIKPGDVFMVPGGLPHAIGEGVFMIEIMEPTDFAVRIEFERGGYTLPPEARFMGRDVDFALSMFDFSAYSFERLKQKFFVQPRLLAQSAEGALWSLFDERYTPCFRAQKLSVRGIMKVAHEGFRALIVTSGAGEISCGGAVMKLGAGSRLLLPHQSEDVTLFASSSGLEAVIALPPVG